MLHIFTHLEGHMLGNPGSGYRIQLGPVGTVLLIYFRSYMPCPRIFTSGAICSAHTKGMPVQPCLRQAETPASNAALGLVGELSHTESHLLFQLAGIRVCGLKFSVTFQHDKKMA